MTDNGDSERILDEYEMLQRRGGLPTHYAVLGRLVNPAKNPPCWVEDEDIWERAKEAVAPRWENYDEPYAVVTYVYEQMGGGFGSC